MKKLDCLVVAAVLCVAGCNKPAAPETKAEPVPAQSNEVVRPDAQDKPANGPADGADKADAQPAAAADDKAPAAQAPAAFRADFSSKEFPEIHTHDSVTSEAVWGQIKRTTLEWADDIEIFHEIPVFSDNSPAFAAINAEMEKIQQAFFSKETLDSPWEYEFMRHENADGGDADDGDKYTYVYRAAVKESSDKFVSITLDMEWYMGGVADYGTQAFVFDRATGSRLKLGDVYQKDDKAVHAMVTNAVKSYVSEHGDSELMEWGALDKMTDFEFYVENGVPHVVFKKYEIAAGAAGAFDIELPKP